MSNHTCLTNKCLSKVVGHEKSLWENVKKGYYVSNICEGYGHHWQWWNRNQGTEGLSWKIIWNQGLRRIIVLPWAWSCWIQERNSYFTVLSTHWIYLKKHEISCKTSGYSQNHGLHSKSGEFPHNQNARQRLARQLIYLTIMQPDITYAVLW